MLEAYSLLGVSATVGVIHTLLGPDHYLPLAACARARGWRLPKALAITGLFGLAHLLGSVALAALGLYFGWTVAGLAAVEGWRGSAAAWLLLGAGVAYLAWAVRRLARGGQNRQDTHSSQRLPSLATAAPTWLLVAFVVGPCEPLIPLLLAPAGEGNWLLAAAVLAVFALATVGTMLAAVAAACGLFSQVRVASFTSLRHVLAAGAITLCGLALHLGW